MLTVDPLPQLQLRCSEKWTGHGPDVIASTIAEMDFPAAAPIVEALYAAVGRHDLGYTSGFVPELAEAFAGFAARRMNWTADPGQVSVVPDVMIGLLELARRPPDREGPARQARGVRLQGPSLGLNTDNDDGIALDHIVERGNPADAAQLAPAVGRVIRRTPRRPRTDSADRGYGEAKVDNELHELGVRTVVIPRKGRPGKARQAHERRRAFRRTVKWSTGSEARSAPSNEATGGIVHAWTTLKEPGSGPGTGCWPTNLVKIAALAA